MPDKEIIHKEIKNAIGPKEAKNLEEYWLFSVGETIYKKFIKSYNKKMWLVDSNTELDTFEWSQKNELTSDRNKASEQIPDYIPIKDGPEEAYENCYSGYPYANNGYDDYFSISTKDAKVLLNTMIEKYDIPNKTVYLNNEKMRFDIIINTISPDTLFDFQYGELKFIGRDFHKIVLPMKECFPKDVFFLYYANDEAFTRIVEYKKFTKHESNTTLLGLEIASNKGKHYPMPIKSEIEKAEKYFEIMPDGVFSIGRAGKYDYNVDIDDCIVQAMEVADEIS
jgi:UDP-galactopyranose mutase